MEKVSDKRVLNVLKVFLIQQICEDYFLFIFFDEFINIGCDGGRTGRTVEIRKDIFYYMDICF